MIQQTVTMRPKSIKDFYVHKYKNAVRYVRPVNQTPRLYKIWDGSGSKFNENKMESTRIKFWL